MGLILGILLGFGATYALVPPFIQYFKHKKIGQTTREEGPLWHEVKTGTPTMGGTVFVAVSIIANLVVALLTQSLNAEVWTMVSALVLFGGIGFVDDFISIFKKQNEGLTAKQKFLLQILFSAIVMLIPYVMGLELSIPLGFITLKHPLWLVLFAIVWINGFSNAVNLTDGLDGLATGLGVIAYACYGILAYLDNNNMVFNICMTIVASLIAFLCFNHKPAKIFMGDVGSLALGAGLATLSLLMNNPWSLLIIGIVFVIETVSVILQVASFKLTGKRIFKMSPIHHHFEMSGWTEEKVVSVFWGVGMAAAFVYLIYIII